MNVKEISPDTQGTLPHYIGAAIGMTIATIWIIVAFQSQYLLPKGYPFIMRLAWPLLLALKFLGLIKLGEEKDDKKFKKGATGDTFIVGEGGPDHIHKHGEKGGL